MDAPLEKVRTGGGRGAAARGPRLRGACFPVASCHCDRGGGRGLTGPPEEAWSRGRPARRSRLGPGHVTGPVVSGVPVGRERLRRVLPGAANDPEPSRGPRGRPWGLRELGSPSRMTELTTCGRRSAWNEASVVSEPTGNL
ncbi:hypothetical protein J1605_006167 [Eschrichtius robustus]|uniref:Uncharacterized protein n=1 Tax=Eschrichtius robustus TaxID=9764 RepID=A0AB34H318_ESCRO|nr:hypothetical protein J1605_006167 [Eschrichtius robustus]